MPILTFILLLALIGFLLWLATTKIPMDPTIKTILICVVVFCVVVWVLQVLGVLESLKSVQVPRL